MPGCRRPASRAVFEARGEILTVPAEKGDIRNLTNTPGAADRDPAWSPDGKSIAYFSDESGEYELHVRAAARQRRGEEVQSSATRHRSSTTRVGRRTARRSPTPTSVSTFGTSISTRASPRKSTRYPTTRTSAVAGVVVARQQMARLFAAVEELSERRLPLLARSRASRTRSPTA